MKGLKVAWAPGPVPHPHDTPYGIEQGMGGHVVLRVISKQGRAMQGPVV